MNTSAQFVRQFGGHAMMATCGQIDLTKSRSNPIRQAGGASAGRFGKASWFVWNRFSTTPRDVKPLRLRRPPQPSSRQPSFCFTFAIWAISTVRNSSRRWYGSAERRRDDGLDRPTIRPGVLEALAVVMPATGGS